MQKIKPGFLLLPCIFLSLVTVLFLYASWRSLHTQSEFVALCNKFDEFESAAASLGLWAVALARQEFAAFQKSKEFRCILDQWPPGYKKFSGNLTIECLHETALEIKAVLVWQAMQKELVYKVEKNKSGAFLHQQVI